MSDGLWLVFGLLSAAVILVGVVTMWRVWMGDYD